MNRLVKEVEGVLKKYKIPYTSEGIERNLTEWERNKGDLVNLLRKHPLWNEETLSVTVESPDLRINTIYEEWAAYEGMEYLHIVYDNSSSPGNKTVEAYLEFCNAVNSICEAGEAFLTPASAKRINKITGCDFKAGEKTSRILNKLCVKYGVSEHDNYGKIFSKVADCLNPVQRTKLFSLSVHPCDYLELSNKDNTWFSCLQLGEGKYKAGTLSYMNDSSSMVFYNASGRKPNEKLYRLPKNSRQVFSFGNDILVQCSLYPTEREEMMESNRKTVQQIIKDCWHTQEIEWSMLPENENNSYRGNGIGALQPSEYRNVSYIDYPLHNKPNHKLLIGTRAYCVSCGKALVNRSSLTCMYKCEDGEIE